MIDHELKLIKPGEVRVRFAPSPTGPLHIGSARTALFNYFFAKKNQGSFILRIEDTDIERSDPKWEKDILDSLKWLRIEWTEGPIADAQNQKSKRTLRGASSKNQKYMGEYGPYRQSERIPIYTKYLKKLLNEKKAYFCFCSQDELEARRQYLMSIGEAPRYNGKCAQLSEKEVKKLISQKKPSIIRFKVPVKKLRFLDLIRGKVEFDTGLIGDIAIAKNPTTRGPNESLGGWREGWSPLYNFGVVIDDFEMKISHIIRGEDHLSNTPKQILIQEALNFPRPKYAHLPLILGPDRAKLSKRHGTTALSDYREDGYLPEAIINFIAFLGWNPGDEREIFSMNSLIKEFSLENIQKGGAIFNIKRLDYLNGFYIRQKSTEKLTELAIPYLIKDGLIVKVKGNPGNPEELKLFKEEKGKPKYKIKETKEGISLETLEKIISIYQERLKKISEISQLTDFFFKEKLEYEKNLLRWREMTDNEIKNSLDKLEKILSKIKVEDWTKENLEKTLLPESEKFAKELSRVGDLSAEARRPEADRGYFLWPLRVALTGKEASAGPFEIAEILGKEKALKRIQDAKKACE